MAHVNNYIEYHAGSSPATARQQGQVLLMGSVSNQAYIEGINDDFLVAAIITSLGLIPIFFLHTKKKNKSKNNNVNANSTD